MSANAMEMMVVPVVGGIFLVIMLGAAGRGLVSMVAVVVGAWHSGEPAALAPAAGRESLSRASAEADRIPAEDDLAAAVA